MSVPVAMLVKLIATKKKIKPKKKTTQKKRGVVMLRTELGDNYMEF